MEGGIGNDLMGGGAGQDVFVFATGSGSDALVNFELWQDLLLLNGIDPDQVRVQTRGGNVLIDWGTSDLITLSQPTWLDDFTPEAQDLFAW